MRLQCDCCKSVLDVSETGEESALFIELRKKGMLRCPACNGYLMRPIPDLEETRMMQIFNLPAKDFLALAKDIYNGNEGYDEKDAVKSAQRLFHETCLHLNVHGEIVIEGENHG
ncbi:hypothetical protein AGMMS50268_16870 [Spirochaetia bacterium]|nr:hypothetical protein AGMMS50268_16870 [Spirochaetia bacterium]